MVDVQFVSFFLALGEKMREEREVKEWKALFRAAEIDTTPIFIWQNLKESQSEPLGQMCEREKEEYVISCII